MRLAILLTLVFTTIARAQWQIEDSHSHASLRGIHSLGRGVAWASGSGGTVLRTTDDGKTWQACSVPPDGAALDFRAVQAFDANTAIVMSAGTGDLSRLYKTTDGCKSWKLALTNPDGPDEGFFDALLFITPQFGLVFGDPPREQRLATSNKQLATATATPTATAMRNPVEGGYILFRIRVTHDFGETWIPVVSFGDAGVNLAPLPGEGLFAASNSSAVVLDGTLWIGTGGGRVLKRKLYETPEQRTHHFESAGCAGQGDPISKSCGIPWMDWRNVTTPLAGEGGTAGIFSLAFRSAQVGVAVGGDYKKPGESARTAGYTVDGGVHWLAAERPPHGYRAAIAFDTATKTWIAVGPNGTDGSSDDGRTWVALKPAASDPPDADQGWNALSLPFAVGQDGRIGKYRRRLPVGER